MNSLILLAQVPGAAGSRTNNVSTNGMNWAQLVELRWERGELVFTLGPVILGLVILSAVGFLAWQFWLRKKMLPDYDVVEAELDIAKLGRVKLKPNHDNVQIAHQAWVELMTRKAALPFDDDYDVVVEVYDSYYQLFGRLRDLTKSIPAQKLRRCSDTRKLVDVMVRVLNQGLRPHLTRWQARFRRWYEGALEESSNKGKSPQEIQKQFPDYAALVADLKALQINVVKYGEFLRELAQGKGE